MGAVVIAATGVAVLVWLWYARPERRRAVLALVAASGLGFQVLHVAEHVVQSGVWAAAPDRPPFLTPWATWGAEALAVTGDPALGQELLHLLGNAVFLVGLLALTAGTRTPSRTLKSALAWQGGHLLEHVALSLTTAVWGRAIGVTTLLGTLDAGPSMWRLRVLAHLGLNSIATLFAVIAVAQLVRARAVAGREDPPDEGPTSGISQAVPAGSRATAASAS